jgi:hypothetical protein
MLFTTTSPERPVRYLRLYSRPDDAWAAAREGRRIYGVAVSYDGSLHRLTPTFGRIHRDLDPGWVIFAEHQPDGSIIAHGPIPGSLYVS